MDDTKEKALQSAISSSEKLAIKGKITIEIEKLDLGDAIICDDDGKEKIIMERK